MKLRASFSVGRTRLRALIRECAHCALIGSVVKGDIYKLPGCWQVVKPLSNALSQYSSSMAAWLVQPGQTSPGRVSWGFAWLGPAWLGPAWLGLPGQTLPSWPSWGLASLVIMGPHLVESQLFRLRLAGPCLSVGMQA